MITANSLDLSALTREVKLLLELLRADDNTYPSKELFNNIDWNHFLQLTRHHRVYPIVYKRLKQIDKSLIPSWIIPFLYKQYEKNTFQMLYLSGEMEQLIKLFCENHIRALLLKGPAIAADLYGDISLRTSRDLDILIKIKDLNRAEQLLKELGYVKDDYFSTILNDWKWRHHHITFTHPEKQIHVELHWRLNPGPSKEPSFQELWERRRKSLLTSYPVYYLGSEDLFLFLVMHGSRHGWSRLRWLVDIRQMMEQTLDWKAIVKLLGKYQHLHIGGQVLVLASQLLHAPMTGEASALVKGNRPHQLAQDAMFYIRQMVNLHTLPLPAAVSKYHSRHLFSLMSARQKLLFIISFLHPYPHDAETLPLPKPLHFLYFILRPLLWAWRKTTKHAIS